MLRFLKKIASKMPPKYQQEIKRHYYKRKIKRGTFGSTEREFSELQSWVNEGDNVLDIGANIGLYTIKLSNLVGQAGRVFSFEPVPQTFEMLSSNVGQLQYNNTTLFNVAASDATAVLQMELPIYNDVSLKNYYTAHLTNEGGELSIVSVAIDSLDIPLPIKLAKIDVEGHEISVLRGMTKLIARDHPILIIEGDSEEVHSFLESHNYTFEQFEGSHNRVYK